jgi:transcription elongation factor Elf1
MSTFIECPRCGQGSVAAYRLKATAEVAQVCDECEAVWPREVEPTETNFRTLEDFMGERGLPSLWDELEELEWP